MDPWITQRRPFTVLGVTTQVRQGSETTEMFAAIWGKFGSRQEEIGSVSIGARYFGVNFLTEPEQVQTGQQRRFFQ
jgi:hypothetical protein